MAYIKGNFRKAIFQSDTGYTIGIFKVLETDDEELEDYINRTITFTGYFHELNDVDKYIFYGNLVFHNKYGDQFQVEKYERLKPEESDAILEFLSSSIFKGIGKTKAKKIVDALGKDTLTTILENPKNLILIPTITEKNANLLHEQLVNYEASYKTILRLSEMGFSTKESMKIYNCYKDRTSSVLDDDIYDIVSRINSITFKRVDYVFLKDGNNKDDIRRIKATICYIIRTLMDTTGHSYFLKEEIAYYLPRVLGVRISEESFDKAVEDLIIDLKLVKKDNRIYLFESYEAEEYIAKRLRLLSHEKDIKKDNIDECLKQLEEYFDIDYNEDQEDAIKKAYLKKLLIITGGPGTGKTTILRGIIELYREILKIRNNDLSKKIALLAPTGRAAKRMSETTGFPASTIHRFLKWNKETDCFGIDEYNKSDVEVVILDEASMIDMFLFHNLLKGLHADCKIIIVGDYEQLPSVGPGQLLQDFIESNVLSVVHLNKLYRQNEDSSILNLAYDIRDKKLDKSIFNVTDDLTFIKCNSDEVMEQVLLTSEAFLDLSYKNFQVLAPMYKTINGIDNLNINLQELFNPKNKTKKELKIGDVIYRENDKVIQLTNMPDDNVFNGDIGIITKIETGKNKVIYIDFDGNLVKYTPSNFANFKHAYAISIHKSQGSETDVVIIPLVKDFHKMLYRKLIYTGVTRCKKKLFLIGDIKQLEYAINNESNLNRRTTVKEFLINGIN